MIPAQIETSRWGSYSTRALSDMMEIISTDELLQKAPENAVRLFLGLCYIPRHLPPVFYIPCFSHWSATSTS